MNQVAPSPLRRSSAAPARWVTHPTARWPGAPPSREDSTTSRPSGISLSAEGLSLARRKRRVLRESPSVPWPWLISGVSVVAVLIVLVLCQRAQLVANQYTLVDLKVAKNRALKERAEIKLAIQRLSALERVDGMSRKNLGMIRPGRRFVLDLTAPTALRMSASQVLVARRAGTPTQ